MAHSDQPREFVPVQIAVMTVSDSRTEKDDTSGNLIVDKLREAGHTLQAKTIVKDEKDLIVAQLRTWIEDPQVDVVISTGGTGLTGRDVTPEAFAEVWEKPIEGFGELFRWVSFQKIGTSTIQSRAAAGVANGTYLFAVPGSPNACRDAWDEILKDQLDSRHRPCNFVEIMPRLMER